MQPLQEIRQHRPPTPRPHHPRRRALQRRPTLPKKLRRRTPTRASSHPSPRRHGRHRREEKVQSTIQAMGGRFQRRPGYASRRDTLQTTAHARTTDRKPIKSHTGNRTGSGARSQRIERHSRTSSTIISGPPPQCIPLQHLHRR